MQNRKYILFTGICWACSGLYLYFKGFSLLNSVHASLWLNMLGIILGAIKYGFVLQKAAQKMISHISNQPSNATLWNIYPSYYAKLLLGMIALGVSLNIFPIPTVVRGVVDLAIGQALMLASIFISKKQKSHKIL